MDLETKLFHKIKELTQLLNELKQELETKKESNTEQTQKELVKLYKEIELLQFTINTIKSNLHTTIDQFAFVSTINEKDSLTMEDEKRVQELFQTTSTSEENFYKKDYSGKEAEAIRTAFERPLYTNSEKDFGSDETHKM